MYTFIPWRNIVALQDMQLTDGEVEAMIRCITSVASIIQNDSFATTTITRCPAPHICHRPERARPCAHARRHFDESGTGQIPYKEFVKAFDYGGAGAER